MSKLTKYVLITGCSAGGIGSSLASSFSKRGLHVFATARSLSKMSHLSSLLNITLITLDVTSPSSIASAVSTDSAHTGGKFDYLVNNAGVNYTTPFLDTSIDKATEVFGVNFWGILTTIQAFTPLNNRSQRNDYKYLFYTKYPKHTL
jgi:1-acylglycerone phosphate reductase